MKSIFKYPIQVTTDNQQVKMPTGARILCAQMQSGTLCLWAEVDPRIVTQEFRFIEVFGTGQPISEEMGVERNYIGTTQQGGFVWHVYENTGV